MKNKSYFGKFSNNKKLFKKILISFIAVLIIFIPSFLIALNYLSASDAVTEGDEITVSIYSNDILLFSESAIKQNALPNSLVSIFDSILNGLSKEIPAQSDLNAVAPLTITHTLKGDTATYTCYFFTDGSDRNFLIDKDGEYFKIAQTDAAFFLSSTYSQSLYPSSSAPKLYTSSDDEIIPESLEWYYKNASMKYIQSVNTKTSDEKLTYDMAGALDITFDTAPDECIIEVYKSGIIFAKIVGTDLSKITVTPGTVLNFKITATWEQTAHSDFYGTIEYNFDAILRDRADFIVNKTSINSGDFIVLACTNILDPSKIEFSSTPDINFTPTYFESEGMVYALIPFNATLPAGVYSLSFTYGAASETIDVTLALPAPEESVIVSSAKDSYFLNYVSEKSIAGFDDILTSTDEKASELLYFGGKFLDYTDHDATEKYLFNTNFKDSGNTADYTLYGNLFEFDDKKGTPVKAANSGRVISTGYSDHIGSFVVIEHGLGLKTVYGHLGAINVQIGDIVLRGQSIGRGGEIKSATYDSFLLLTYVFDVAVNYSNLSGAEIPLYLPEATANE